MATSLGTHYKAVRSQIDSDGDFLVTKETKKHAEFTFGRVIDTLNLALNRRMGQIVVQRGLGFASTEELEKAYPNPPYSPIREEFYGIETITFKKGDAKSRFYFSEPLRTWIAGLPEVRREDGVYCHVTGKKISRD